ncbi:MAG TPA: twin-arginine translocation signal domain-containing protein, partial [Tepidisphaeraceae bacterium]|nr:twin-arginine translocation signal domain-containing protein [Tepidisphaeraceae bacterium]
MRQISRITRRDFLAHSALAGAAIAAGCSTDSRNSRPSATTAPEVAEAIAAAKRGGFYVPENPNYTIFASGADSLRFTLTRCMTTYKGHACSTSSFVDPEGKIMDWHDFGPLEGPGWASNAVGGAYELIKWARFTHDAEMEKTAVSVLDHVLNNGFIDRESGLIRGYRHVPRNQIVLNYKHNSDWFCPGSNAKIAVQMLLCADLIPQRREALRTAAKSYAQWMGSHLQSMPNGWFPRRCTPTG